MIKDAQTAIKQANLNAEQGELAPARRVLLPFLHEPECVEAYARAALRIGANVDMHRDVYQAMQALKTTTQDLEVVRSLYELYGLNGEIDIDGGLSRLVAAEKAGASNAFDLVASSMEGFTKFEERNIEQWIEATQTLADTFPHFGLLMLSLVDGNSFRVHHLQYSRETGKDFTDISYTPTRRKIPSLSCSQLVDQAMKPGFEFGCPCLLGLTLRMPAQIGYCVSQTILEQSQFISVPFTDAIGIGDQNERDRACIGHENSLVSFLSITEKISDLGSLGKQCQDFGNPYGIDSGSLRFEQWETDHGWRRCTGGAIKEDLGFFVNVLEQIDYKSAPVNLTQTFGIFAPELDMSSSEIVQSVQHSQRAVEDISLAEKGINLAALRIASHQEILNEFLEACKKHGLKKAAKLVRQIKPTDEGAIDRLGEELFYLVAREKRLMEVDSEEFFVDAGGYAGLMECLAEISSDFEIIRNIESLMNEAEAIETLSFESEGYEYTIACQADSGDVDSEVLIELLQALNYTKQGQFVLFNAPDFLTIAFLPTQLGTLLIEHYDCFYG